MNELLPYTNKNNAPKECAIMSFLVPKCRRVMEMIYVHMQFSIIQYIFSVTMQFNDWMHKYQSISLECWPILNSPSISFKVNIKINTLPLRIIHAFFE